MGNRQDVVPLVGFHRPDLAPLGIPEGEFDSTIQLARWNAEAGERQIHTLCQAQAGRCPHGDELCGTVSKESRDPKQEQGPTHGRVQEAAPRASE